MKKSFLLLIFTLIALFGFVAPSVQNETVNAAASGKVVFHYQKWDANYDNVGLWVWDTGTDGTTNAVEKAGTDAFGAYFEVMIGSDATTMGAIPIADEFSDETNRWNNKDSMLNEAGDDRINLSIDVTAAAAGAVVDVYFFSGSDKVFYASNDYANVFIVYFTASEEYEDNLGLHAWGGWYTDEALGTWGTWGTPTQAFTGNFLTPEGKLGKVGMIQALVGEEEADSNLIVYAGDDATKKTGDVTDVADGLVGGDVTGIYVSSDVYKGFDKASLFADASFAFKFIPFDNTAHVLSGTYASKPDSILVKFSADVSIKYEDLTATPETTTYQKYEIVGYNYVEKANPIVQDTTTYDAYTPTAIPDGMARLVIHYQKWDGNYSNVGFWTWGTGTSGTSDGVAKAGVDDFGAVIEINLGVDATSVGLIPIADEMDSDARWNHKDSLGGADLGFDATGIQAGEVVNLYFFSGGNVFFEANNEKANVIVLYMNNTGEYSDTLGLHFWWKSWDQEVIDGDNVTFPAWDNPLLMTPCFSTPDGMPGVGALLTISPDKIANNPGIILHDGDTKYSGETNIEGVFTGMVAGDMLVVYAGVSGEAVDSYAYTLDRAEFVSELMNFEKGDPIYDYVDYEKLVYPYVDIDIDSFFSLYKDGVLVEDAFKSIDYNNDDTTITELVLVLNTALDNTSTYELRFNNGKEGIDLQEASIAVNVDTTGPEIYFISKQEVTITAGEGWNDDLWPSLKAVDDRDGTVTDRIYVKSGDGTVDMNEVGTHIVTLTVFDNWGNETTAEFKIIVQAPATGCTASNSASIIGLASLGVVLFFVARKRWL